eukprot:TRINITY_DN48098_c0_g1_i1.p1 TRINITY_DN48098_c0_g1~~TRINITY_DN48098_c0_g1_i1.p1  ORF type:complete len:170 (+),score=15.83 TRINITY_DN48098_c0_g1_i1:43-552(+)
MAMKWMFSKRMANLGVCCIGFGGLCKLGGVWYMKEEFESFGYPEPSMQLVGGLEVIGTAGCLASRSFGPPVILFVGGGATYSIIRRALGSDTPELERYIETVSALLEGAAIHWIAWRHGTHLQTFYRGQFMTNMWIFMAGAAVGLAIHTVTGTEPRWRGWEAPPSPSKA